MRLTLATASIIEPGCFSVLLSENGWPLLVTCERTFDDIRPVIPAGVFTCKRRMFNHGGYMTHEITGIVGHADVLFHRGNVEADSLGCVLTGLTFGVLNGMPAVLSAAAGFERYWAVTKDYEQFELEVIGR